MPISLRHLVATALLTAAVALPLSAQTCTGNGKVWKNDSLPDLPTGSYQIGIVPGLCDNEAAMSIFDVGGPCKVEQVGVLYAHKFSTNGVQAIVDIEIYDGATALTNGKYVLGPLVFQLSSGSSNLQIQSTGLNVYTLPAPVKITSGRAVIGFRMLQNFAGGSCTIGYDANFAVDPSAGCGIVGKNVLDAIGHGPVDPHKYTGFGLPLCPIYFRGNWVIRACITPDVSVTWTGFPTPGGSVSLKYTAPGQGGDNYFAVVSNGIATGVQLPWGKLPTDPDPLFTCFLEGCRALMFNGMGTFNANGDAFGAINIPNSPVLVNSNLSMYVAFFTYSGANFFTWKTISGPSRQILIN